MEEVQDYLSDISEDAFDSFEDDLSRDLLPEIQQPPSSLRITTAAMGSSSHHDQRSQDYVIDIIGGGGGSGGGVGEEEEEGGGGGEEEEDVEGSGEEEVGGGSGGGEGGGGGGGEGGGEEEEDVEGGGEEEVGGGERGGEEEDEDEEGVGGASPGEGGGGESSGEEEDEEEQEVRRGASGGEGGGGERGDEEEDEDGEGRGGGGGGGGEDETGEANEGDGYNNTSGGRHLLISQTKCIFKVPKHIREDDEIAYTPKWVSIGPYHYGNRKLSFMESHKKSILASTRWNPDRRSSLRTAMLEFEVRARRCYSKRFNNIDSHTFGGMMLTDAFFIIQLFLAYDIWCKDDRELPDNRVFTTRWRLPNLCQDLLMLENQLPFFILAQVFAILTNESANSLKKLAIQFFQQVHFGKVAVMANSSRFKPPENPKHLLDLFHSSFIQVDRGERQQKRNTSSSLRMETKYWVNNTSSLSRNGVRLIGTKGNPLDIQFSRLGLLRIPTFCINDRTITVLKNLLAYEQGWRLADPYFTSVAIFFSNIAAGPDDVKILREAGIIQHHPADDQTVVLLLQQLYRAAEYSSNDCLIKNQVELIDRYVISGRGRLMGALRREALANAIRFLLLFVTLFFSLSLNTFRIRV